ncbi:MAG TPA: S8 family serine peptidase [Isosphaeraceae bacterium]|jgi:subtilisin family serine protease|nr:S8 family serine peptidase [Isosphaeraceae bacterium]
MNPMLPQQFPSDDPPPSRIIGYVSVRGDQSLFDEKPHAMMASSKPFHAKKTDLNQVRRSLEKAGFEIIAESPLGLSVSGPPGAYEDLTGGKVHMQECLVGHAFSGSRYVTHVDIVGKNQPDWLGVGIAKSETTKIDGVLLDKPKYPYGAPLKSGPSPIPPNSSKYHLRLPNDVATALNATPLHQDGIRGDNILVAMPDTGHYKHPYFLAQGYKINPTITVVQGANPGQDPFSHGTGESSNIFAMAPGIILQAIRCADDQGSMLATAGFLKAKSLNPLPRIITNSWGGDYPQYPPGTNQPDPADMAFALEVQHAIEQGIVVIFSAGNGHFGPEPQIPGVIAAGGVFMDQTGALQASDYSSGYFSPWFNGVKVPTVCGLVGMLPRAQYLMLPVPSGSDLDVSESQDTAEEVGDGTTQDDGWAMFSGTSAAAPQLAGLAALLLSVKPKLTPAQVAEAMIETAIDIVRGHCHPRFNNNAVPGPDLATGQGLVNAKAAVAYAQQKF